MCLASVLAVIRYLRDVDARLVEVGSCFGAIGTRGAAFIGDAVWYHFLVEHEREVALWNHDRETLRGAFREALADACNPARH